MISYHQQPDGSFSSGIDRTPEDMPRQGQEELHSDHEDKERILEAYDHGEKANRPAGIQKRRLEDRF